MSNIGAQYKIVNLEKVMRIILIMRHVLWESTVMNVFTSLSFQLDYKMGILDPG